jgi:uncharacterized protein
MVPIRVGVISDTHCSGADDLAPELVEDLAHVDLIVHVGDYTGKKLVDDLRGLGEFRGVYGNMDPPAVRSVLPEREVVELGGKRIGLVHGWGSPIGLQTRALDCFSDVDAVVYGHSHMARSEVVDGVLAFNPGSASGRFPALRKSYGVLIIEETIQSEIVTIG